jgi:hypothetical protein
MLRIEANRGTDELIVTASGELTAKHLPELGRVIREAAAEGLAIVLDLEAVSFADRESISFLAHGEGRRARILGAPAYVQEWIRLENLPEKGETTMSKRTSLVAALVIAVSFVSFGCEHLKTKEISKADEQVLAKKAPVALNPYQNN